MITELTQSQQSNLVDYVVGNIPYYEERAKYANYLMDRSRCPLKLADEALYEEIIESVVEWLEYNEIEKDEPDDTYDEMALYLTEELF